MISPSGARDFFLVVNLRLYRLEVWLFVASEDYFGTHNYRHHTHEKPLRADSGAPEQLGKSARPHARTAEDHRGRQCLHGFDRKNVGNAKSHVSHGIDPVEHQLSRKIRRFKPSHTPINR